MSAGPKISKPEWFIMQPVGPSLKNILIIISFNTTTFLLFNYNIFSICKKSILSSI